MDIQVDLAPFFYDVADGVRFKLRPLTQPEVNEVLASFEEDRPGIAVPTARSFYIAGCMGLDAGREIQGLNINGKPAKWPRDKNQIPQQLVANAGAKLIVDAFGEYGEEETEKNSSTQSP